ncbi:hypothetical protein MTO96_022935 [Rhipicephalus appendiculatus]
MAPGSEQLRCSRGLLLLLLVATSPLVSAQQGDNSTRAASRTGLSAVSTDVSTSTATEKPDPVKEAFDSMSERITRIMMKEFYPMVSELIYDPRLSTGCIGSLMKIGQALKNFDIWAVEMVDAIGKPHAGVTQGRIAMYGAYDQCLAIRHNENLFQGKYCMIHMFHDGSEMPATVYKIAEKFLKHHNLEYIGNISRLNDKEFVSLIPLLKYGVCLPSVCQQEDVQVIIDHFVGDLNLNIKASWCKIEEPVKLDRRQTLIVCLFVLWTAFLLFGTAYDIYRTMLSTEEIKAPKYHPFISYLSDSVQSVSLRRAVKKLMDMPNWGDYSNRLGFVHGVRVFSATWVLLGHSHMLRDLHASSNMIRFLKRIQDDFLFTVQLNAFMSVETFLVITFIVPMAALFGFVYLIPALADGPVLHDYWHLFVGPCEKNWWKIFTMSQNYMDDFKDMSTTSLPSLAPIVLVFIMPKWFKGSLYLMGLIVVATCLTTGIQVYVHEYTPFNIIFTTNVRQLIESAMNIYDKAYTHAPPLFVGMIFGCLAVKRHHLSKMVQSAAWVLAVTVSLAALLGVRSWFAGRQPQRLEAAIYGGMHRVSWGLSVGWVMYACATGRGGFVTKILAWPIMYPLGRLSFSVYMVHILLMGTNAVLSREHITQQPFLHAQTYISQVVMSYVLGAIVYLFIECPVAGLDNEFFRRFMNMDQLRSDNTKYNNESQDLKAVQVAAGNGATKIGDASLLKLQLSNGVAEVPKNVCNGCHHNGYTNGACETDIDEKDTAANGAIVSVKF